MKLAFLFPGQGSQSVGMGVDIYTHYPSAAKVFDQADKIMAYKLSTYCFYGPEERLKETQIAQPALFTTSAATLTVLQESGIKPDAVAGHSVGEYAALLAAVSLTLDVGLNLVSQRGEYMRQAAGQKPGAMAAIIGLSSGDVSAVCKEAQEQGVGTVEAANLNGGGQVVISGETKAVETASELARKLGAKRVVILPVSGAFHSSLMTPAADRMGGVLGQAPINDAKVPVVANFTAGYVTKTSDIREALTRQIDSPVRWEESIQRLAADGFDTFVEVGSGTVLCGLVKRIVNDAATYSTADCASLQQVISALGPASKTPQEEPAHIFEDTDNSDPSDWVDTADTE